MLKEFLRADYRGLADHLADNPSLRAAIELAVVPHFTTFQKAADRLLRAAPARAALDAVLQLARRREARRGPRIQPASRTGDGRPRQLRDPSRS